MKNGVLWSGRYLCWFSCGAASAVAAKLVVEKYGEQAEIIYCDTLSTEHEDNARFMNDVSRWIGKEVKIIRSTEYTSIDDVFIKTRYMAGLHGARCTTEMKKMPRLAYQDRADTHIFGYTADEQVRIEKFEKENSDLFVEWILSDKGISKQDCYQILLDVGIALPVMYSLGFKNNNCKGCVKATSAGYWNLTRRHFPDVFKRRCQQSRALGVRLVRYKGERIFLDELPEEDAPIDADYQIDCGPVCQTPAMEATK